MGIVAPRVVFDGSSLRAKDPGGMHPAEIGAQLLKPAWAMRITQRKEISETSVEFCPGLAELLRFGLF